MRGREELYAVPQIYHIRIHPHPVRIGFGRMRFGSDSVTHRCSILEFEMERDV